MSLIGGTYTYMSFVFHFPGTFHVFFLDWWSFEMLQILQLHFSYVFLPSTFPHFSTFHLPRYTTLLPSFFLTLLIPSLSEFFLFSSPWIIMQCIRGPSLIFLRKLLCTPQPKKFTLFALYKH